MYRWALSQVVIVSWHRDTERGDGVTIASHTFTLLSRPVHLGKRGGWRGRGQQWRLPSPPPSHICHSTSVPLCVHPRFPIVRFQLWRRESERLTDLYKMAEMRSLWALSRAATGLSSPFLPTCGA